MMKRCQRKENPQIKSCFNSFFIQCATFQKVNYSSEKTGLLLIDCTLNAVFYSLECYVAVNIKYCVIIEILEYGVISF